jgi:hypothetical protein
MNLFQHPDAHPVVLDMALLREYGPEWFLWEPETLAWRIPKDFKTPSVSDLSMAKIQAMKTLHVSGDPWEEWHIFLWCCMPLAGQFPDFEVMQVPTAAQTAVAVATFNRVRDDVKWSDEVKEYLAQLWKNDGVLLPIAPVDFITIDTEGLPLDMESVRRRWPEVRKTRSAPTGQTPEDEQLRRLLDIELALAEDRERIEQQAHLTVDGRV